MSGNILRVQGQIYMLRVLLDMLISEEIADGLLGIHALQFAQRGLGEPGSGLRTKDI
jgi:hypothetical protein